MSEGASKVIVLQTIDGEHIGFTLLNADISQESGECVFIVVPMESELFDAPEVEYLRTMREKGEFGWVVSGGEIIVSRDGENYLRYESGGSLVRFDSGSQIGLWKYTKSK